MDPNTKQIGGSHYRDGGNLQHWDFVTLNGIGYLEGCATKYLSRHRKKGGKQDLEKAQHYVEKLISVLEDGRLVVMRFPDPVISAAEFARANSLGEVEQRAVELIAFWEDLADLDAALVLIRSLIKEH